jgi:hypothetical protein
MSNAYSASLVTQHLLDGAATVLQNAFAPLRSFSRTWEPDPKKPKAVCQGKLVTAGSATLKNATNFEQGDSTVTNIPVTVDQYTQPFQVSNDDLQSGLKLEDLVNVNAKAFAGQLVDVALTPVTSANFPVALIRAAAGFNYSDLALLWGMLKKSDTKNCILDGEWMARIINSPGFFQKAGTGPGAGFEALGWDFIGLNTRWSAAEAGTCGFACNPQALATVAGLPLEGQSATLESRVIDLEGLDIKVAYHVWFSLATRTLWASFDSMFGSSVGDTSAGFLVKSA